MAYPTLEVAVAFGSPPTLLGGVTSYAFTDITSYVRVVSIRRGKQHELDRYEAGTATLVLDNRDRRFDPDYAAGPYYDNVRVMAWIRIRATTDGGGSWKSVYTGLVESWEPHYEQGQGSAGGDAIATVTCGDGFRIVGLRRVTASFASQTAGIRVSAIFTSVGFPSYTIFGTGTTLIAQDVSEVSALQLAQDVERSDGGILFSAATGMIRFYTRVYMSGLARFAVSNATFGDSGAELPYEGLGYSYDDSQIWNRITARLHGTANSDQSVSDSTSAAWYLERQLDIGDLLLTSAAELTDRLNYLLHRYKDPYRRATQMRVTGESPGGDWAEILDLDLHDRITVTRRPPGGGTITADYSVERIEHDISPGGPWDVTFGLVPAAIDQFWILGTSTLGSDTRLGY